jgi:hypothetical protein
MSSTAAKRASLVENRFGRVIAVVVRIGREAFLTAMRAHPATSATTGRTARVLLEEAG